MKKIIVNAITIKMGGGAVVFTHTFNEMSRIEKNVQWIVILDEALKNKINKRKNVTTLLFPWIKKSALHLLFWNEIYLPKLIKSMKADCFYSVINTIPLRKLSCPTLVSVLHAGYFSDEFRRLYFEHNTTIKNKLSWVLRKFWVLSAVKKATAVHTMTKALANDIILQRNVQSDKVIAIHPGIGLSQPKTQLKERMKKTPWRIGYISKYGVQKNFDVIFRAAVNLKARQIDFKIVLTLDQNHMPFADVNALIEKYDIKDVVENHGELLEEQLRELYETLDIFVFPSICEAFGFSLVEAMSYGLPVIASDIENNREILGKHGEFFGIHDATLLANKIISIASDKEKYQAMSKYSLVRSKLFSWEKTAKNTIKVLEKIEGQVDEVSADRSHTHVQ